MSGSVTFTPGQTVQVVSVLISGDTIDEPNETFNINLTSATNATIAAPGRFTATIIDDDPVPTITIAGFSGLERNPGLGWSFPMRVSLSNPSSQTITVNYATADGTAVAGSDYTVTSGTATFAPGETAKDIFVPVTPDQVFEPDETFSVVLSSPTGASLGSPSAATGTILNDDSRPTISINDAVAPAEGHSGTTGVVFTVSLSNPSSEVVTVNFATANGTATAADADYDASSGTLSFPAGTTSQTITVLIHGDTQFEPNESFFVELNSPTNATILDTQGAGTIGNDDTMPTVSIGDVSLSEGDTGTTSFVFALSLSNATYQTVTIPWATANGTASSQGGDYQSTGGILAFAPGQTSQTVTVLVSGDTKFGLDETFTVSLLDATNAIIVDGSGLGVIRNDDPLVAVDDAYSTGEDMALTVSALGVLANDSQADGDPLTSLLVNGPSHGSLTLNADGSFTYSPAPNYSGPDSFTYRAVVGGAASNLATVSLAVYPVQDAPIAAAGDDITGNEGALLHFDGSNSFDADGDSLTYVWNFGDGGTANGKQAQHAYADNGTYTVTLTVNDGQGNSSSDTLQVTVNNVAPVVNSTGPGSGVRGQPREFSFTATDASPVDQQGTFTYTIDWGDGTPVESVQEQASLIREHVFAASGSFTITTTVRDKDGAPAGVSSRAIVITPLAMQGSSLVVGGTTSGDAIVISPSDAGVAVSINGASQGVFQPTELLVYAQAGADTVELRTAKARKATMHVTVPAILNGGSGADTLDARGSRAMNVLLGGADNDTLWGGEGRDILIGGQGADILRGRGEGDILIGATTQHDANVAALKSLLAEWSRGDATYQQRIDHLTGSVPGGLNGGSLLNANTIDDDQAVDQLFGEGEQDWFLMDALGSGADVLKDKKANERATQI